LEGSFASVIGGGPAAAVVFPREVSTRVNKDPRVQKIREALVSPNRLEREAAERVLEEVRLAKQAEVGAEFDQVHSVDRAKRVGSLEAIVAADKMREFIVRCIE